MSRSLRRHHLARMKARARRTYRLVPAAIAVKDADHLATCSCWMCGNPRRYSKGTERLTLQERRGAAIAKLLERLHEQPAEAIDWTRDELYEDEGRGDQ